jgi:hypothetical protein
MAWGDMMGAGAAMGASMGRGNQGSFAQKQPMMGGMRPQMRPQPMMQQRRPQVGQPMGQTPPTFPTNSPAIQRPPMMGGGVGPRMGSGIGNMIRQMGQQGGGMPGPWGQVKQPMPEVPVGNQPQGGEAPPQMQGGFADMLRKMQMQQQQGGMARPQVMPRNGNTGIAGGMFGRGIAPQMNMMPQFEPPRRQPNPWGQEYDQQAPQDVVY